MLCNCNTVSLLNAKLCFYMLMRYSSHKQRSNCIRWINWIYNCSLYSSIWCFCKGILKDWWRPVTWLSSKNGSGLHLSHLFHILERLSICYTLLCLIPERQTKSFTGLFGTLPTQVIQFWAMDQTGLWSWCVWMRVSLLAIRSLDYLLNLLHSDMHDQAIQSLSQNVKANKSYIANSMKG